MNESERRKLVSLCREVDMCIAKYVSMRCVDRCQAAEPCQYCRNTAARIRMDERVGELLGQLAEATP